MPNSFHPPHIVLCMYHVHLHFHTKVILISSSYLHSGTFSNSTTEEYNSDSVERPTRKWSFSICHCLATGSLAESEMWVEFEDFLLRNAMLATAVIPLLRPIWCENHTSGMLWKLNGQLEAQNFIII